MCQGTMAGHKKDITRSDEYDLTPQMMAITLSLIEIVVVLAWLHEVRGETA